MSSERGTKKKITQKRRGVWLNGVLLPDILARVWRMANDDVTFVSRGAR